ncbi:DUF3180 domain-containing protein [Microbacterium sp. R86528]|uniref:DUF3180 domain-containing protein n=1 Tax=Microbacterium sp. R86528 TaxID=3093864 RepID=UPI0037CC3D6E
MKRTGIGMLLIAAGIGAVAGFVIDQVLTLSGRATFSPSVMLPVLLVLLGVFVIVMALPVRRATRGLHGAPVNPFRALRTAILAKSSSIVGAAVAGVAVGLLIFLLTRPVTPSLGSMSAIIATVVGGGALVAAGLIAEHLCTIRKDDDDEQPGGDDPGLRPRLHDH